MDLFSFEIKLNREVDKRLFKRIGVNLLFLLSFKEKNNNV